MLVLFAASCAGDGGVIINVTPTDPSVTVVRLYIGNGARTTDATLSIPASVMSGQAVMESLPHLTYWPRDAQNELDSVAVKPGGSAKFVLVRSDTTDIGAIIAVGYAGAQIVEVATLFDVHLPATKFNEYTLALGRPAQAPYAWANKVPIPAPEATCIGVIDPMQPDPYAATFIVSPDDQDCDGLITGDGRECNPDVWFGHRSANLDELTCLAPGEDSTASCYLGGPECTDDRPVGPTTMCAPTRYCVPKSVCGACQGSLACAEDVSKAPIRPQQINCPLRVEGGLTCEDEIVIHTGPIGGVGCSGVAIADPTHPFSDHLDLGQQQVYVKLEDNCRITLEVKGDAPEMNTSKIGMLVAVDLDNGRGLALPVVLLLDRVQMQCKGSDVACVNDVNINGPELLACATSWSTPTIEPALVAPSNEGVRSPTLTSNLLDIWFVSGNSEIWHASRPSLIAPWGTPKRVTSLEAPNFLTPTVRVSPDGLTMYLSSNRPDASQNLDLFVATRQDASTDQWSMVGRVDELSTLSDEEGGAIDASGTQLVYSSDEGPGAHGMRLATRAGGSLWSNNVALPHAAIASNDENPHLIEDGTAIYFASDAAPLGGKELFAMQKATTSFSGARHIGELGSPASELDPWVSKNQRVIYFASDRSGVMRIYSSRR